MTRKDKIAGIAMIGGVLFLMFVFAVIDYGMKHSGRNYPPSIPPPAVQVGNGEAKLVLASATFRERLGDFVQVALKRPERLDATKWESVKHGAEQIVGRIDALTEHLDGLNKRFSAVRLADQDIAKQVDEILKEFQLLAGESEESSSTLPLRLQQVSQRERESWQQAIAVSNSFREHYAAVIRQYDDQIKMVNSVYPILARMRRGAAKYAELAEVGIVLDEANVKLDVFATELNEIFSLFDSLSDMSEKAMANPPVEVKPAVLASATVLSMPK